MAEIEAVCEPGGTCNLCEKFKFLISGGVSHFSNKGMDVGIESVDVTVTVMVGETGLLWGSCLPPTRYYGRP